MLFNTTAFAVFFAVVFAAYLCVIRWVRLSNALLLVASWVFYAFWDWRFLGLLWLSTGVDFWVAKALGREDDPKRRKRLIGTSVAFQLGILAFFKYTNFLLASVEGGLRALGVDVPTTTLAIVLPVGISFYTFQSLSYTIDVYRRKIEPEQRLLEFACFVALFPQLVAGPIERASHMLPQVAKRRHVGVDRIYGGSFLVLWGLYKKVFIADNVARIVDGAFGRSAELTRAEALVALYAFALQIYCDFSGYTDIARGTAKLLGFDFNLNFARPYLASDPSDFWRRWHISLSSWLRDYLYVSLGGNRGGPLRTYRNLMLTMLLGGLWHGASWTFVVWGAYHGALLVGHRLLRELRERLWPAREDAVPASIFVRAPGRVLAALVMFHLAVLGWLPFPAKSMSEVADFVRAALERPGAGEAHGWLYALAIYGGGLALFELIEELAPSLGKRLPFPLRGLGYAAIVLAILVAGAPVGQTFIYFQF